MQIRAGKSRFEVNFIQSSSLTCMQDNAIKTHLLVTCYKLRNLYKILNASNDKKVLFLSTNKLNKGNPTEIPRKKIDMGCLRVVIFLDTCDIPPRFIVMKFKIIWST